MPCQALFHDDCACAIGSSHCTPCSLDELSPRACSMRASDVSRSAGTPRSRSATVLPDGDRVLPMVEPKASMDARPPMLRLPRLRVPMEALPSEVRALGSPMLTLSELRWLGPVRGNDKRCQ